MCVCVCVYSHVYMCFNKIQFILNLFIVYFLCCDTFYVDLNASGTMWALIRNTLATSLGP